MAPSDVQSEHALKTKRQAAEWLGVCSRTVENLIAQGKLPAIRIGSAVRIDPADLRAFVAAAKNGNPN